MPATTRKPSSRPAPSGAMASIIEQGQENVARLEAALRPAPVTEVATDYLRSNPNNPRRLISEASVREMANGIRQAGGEILQPLLVRPVSPDAEGHRYEVVCGNRRLRAAQALGLPRVPVRVREMDDEDAARFALWENLSREDLNAMDMAESIDLLRRIERLSWEQIGERFGFTRQWGWKQQKLAELPEAVRDLVRSGALAPSKAMLLWQIEGGPEESVALAQRTVAEKLSHRALLLEIALRRKHVLTPEGEATAEDAARKHVLTWEPPQGYQKRRYQRLLQAAQTLISHANAGTLNGDFARALRPLAERVLALSGSGNGSGGRDDGGWEDEEEESNEHDPDETDGTGATPPSDTGAPPDPRTPGGGGDTPHRRRTKSKLPAA